MTYEEALVLAQNKMYADGADSKAVSKLNTKRQRKKFDKGFGRVRELAGLPHSRAGKQHA